EPDLRERTGGAARARWRYVRRPAWCSWTDAGRASYALASAPGLRPGQPARHLAAPGRLVPAGLEEAAGERNAARLVHARHPQRLRDPRAGARTLRRTPVASKSLRALSTTLASSPPPELTVVIAEDANSSSVAACPS